MSKYPPFSVRYTSCDNCVDAIPANQIKQSDLPFTISKPGCYNLSENLVYDPSVNYTSAITIDSDDVNLHLCCHQLSQKPSLLPVKILATGIKVTTGKQNITINATTGSIKGFQGWGILLEGANHYVNIEDVTVSKCGTDTRVPVNALVTHAHVDGGIKLGSNTLPSTRASNIFVKNVIVRDTKNTGILGAVSENLTIEDTLVEDIHSDVGTSISVSGIELAHTNNSGVSPLIEKDYRGYNYVIERTTVRKIRATDMKNYGAIYGMLLRATDNIVVRDCIFSDTQITVEPTRTVFFCCNVLSSGIRNCLFENCQFTKCISTGVYVTENYHSSGNTFVPNMGLRNSGSTKYKNCFFSECNGDYIVGGMAQVYSDNCAIEDCTAHDIKCNGVVVGGIPVKERPVAFGFMLDQGRAVNGAVNNEEDNRRGRLSNAVVKNCNVNTVKNTLLGESYGMVHFAGIFHKFTETSLREPSPTGLPEAIGTPTALVVVKNISYTDCTVHDIFATNGTAAGYLMTKGFGLNVFVCIPIEGEYIFTLAYPYRPYKFADTYKNVALKGCEASDCKGSAASYGINLSSVESPTVCDCITKDCGTGIALTGGVAAVGDFNPLRIILLQAPIPAVAKDLGFTRKGLIQNNKSQNNTIGYWSADLINTFIDNVATFAPDANTVNAYVNIPIIVADGNRAN